LSNGGRLPVIGGRRSTAISKWYWAISKWQSAVGGSGQRAAVGFRGRR
jgi:hypothetical protein